MVKNSGCKLQIRFFKLNIAKNSEIVVFELSALKPLRKIKVSYFDKLKS